jgi:hypothetical protein
MAGQLLGSRFALFDIEDVEGFTAAIANRSGFKLDAHEHEELHVYLIETAWELSRDFRPGGILFSSYAGTTLRLRCIDWHRSRFGRQRWAFRDRVYERPKVELVSLDGNDSARNRLVASLAEKASDLETDCDPDLGGVLAKGGGTRARDLSELGLEPNG